MQTTKFLRDLGEIISCPEHQLLLKMKGSIQMISEDLTCCDDHLWVTEMIQGPTGVVEEWREGLEYKTMRTYAFFWERAQSYQRSQWLKEC